MYKSFSFLFTNKRAKKCQIQNPGKISFITPHLVRKKLRKLVTLGNEHLVLRNFSCKSTGNRATAHLHPPHRKSVTCNKLNITYIIYVRRHQPLHREFQRCYTGDFRPFSKKPKFSRNRVFLELPLFRIITGTTIAQKMASNHRKLTTRTINSRFFLWLVLRIFFSFNLVFFFFDFSARRRATTF